MSDDEEKKTPKIVFAPGCLDSLEAEDQEELDRVTKEILGFFEGKTREELEELSTPVSAEEMLELGLITEEELKSLEEDGGELKDLPPRNTRH